MNTQEADTQFSNLKRLRDELKLQAHLFKAEARDEWERIEKDFVQVEQRFGQLKETAKESAKEIEGATERLLDSVKTGYEKLKSHIS